MRPRKLLYITSGLGVGGAETMLLQLTSRLRERGHAQHVVSMTGPGALGPLLQEAGIAVTSLDMRSLRGLPIGLLKLRSLVASGAPDVIQGWMYHGNLAALATHRICAGRPHRRLYWGIRATIMADGRYERVTALNARLSGCADAIIANSEAGMKEHITRGFQARRFEVIPNGIDTDRFRPDAEARASLRANWGIGPDELVLIHVARVDAMKDHASFLAAIQAMPQAKAILVGLGTKQLDLPPNACALGVCNDVESLYAAADIVVSSSAYGEGFSNVLAEGMSVGAIPVATDVGHARAIVGNIGRIIPPRDSDALRWALQEIVDLPRDARERLGQQSRERIVAEFSIEKAVSRFEELYCDA